jgi:hypothetical protein
MQLKRLLVYLLAMTAAGVTIAAQRGGGGYYGVRRPAADTFKGDFTFCRLAFRAAYGGFGGGWGVDYPRADENLSIRLMEVTKTRVTQDGEGNPYPVIVRLTDPSVFRCPFLMMSEPGGSYFSDTEAENLRAYLLKGGFLWVDDFWGSRAWRNWENQIGKALSPAEYPIVDLTVDHTMFHMLFPVHTLPQIPNIGLWRMERRTSERGADSDELHVRGIQDRKGRVMVLMTHNTDFGDAYEREAEDPSYFNTFSINGYAIGIDVLLYAMTH